ncbi:glycosyl hydrolase [Sulfurimonas sp. ST-25]|uniref:glycosyl hydrolase n=1 Tax=Sulfurimonas sp. ST-25 TaxID=3400151 RepID=UPI003A8C67FA
MFIFLVYISTDFLGLYNSFEANGDELLHTQKSIDNKHKILDWLNQLHNKEKRRVLSGQYFIFNENDVENIYQKLNTYPALVETYLWQTNWGTGKKQNAGNGGLYWPRAEIHRKLLLEYWQKGSLISIHMPIPNPKNMSWQKDLDLTLNEYSRIYTEDGNPINENYRKWLDKLAEHIMWIITNSGNKAVIIIRPLHERSPYFWWGYINSAHDQWTKTKIPANKYIALFRYTVDYLKKEKNLVDHLIITYSMHEKYIEDNYYPGDNYVDLIGLDIYNGKAFSKQSGYAAILDNLYLKYHKPVYASELGWHWNNANVNAQTKNAEEDVILELLNNSQYSFGWLSWCKNNSPIAQKNAKQLYVNPYVITQDKMNWK